MNGHLNLNRDGTERVAYNAVGFPVRAIQSRLSAFQGYEAACHWHNDLEFLLANEGEMEYFVNAKIVRVQAGQAIFVNANRLHYGFSSAKRECRFSCLLFHPSLLGDEALPARRYIAGLASESQPDYLLLDSTRAADAPVLSLLRAILKTCGAKPPYYEMDVQADCVIMAKLLCERMAAVGTSAAPDDAWRILRRMISFMQDNYADRITLGDVAAAGPVCRSKCCQMFKERLGTTAITYLNRYRLECSCALLRDSDMNIAQIATACGFGGLSYFTEQFQRYYSVTPSAFRKRCGLLL